MNTPNSTVCVSIEANGDVSGTGIRASIYALCLGGRLLSIIAKLLSTREASAEFERSYKSALSVQGLALLCTAWYQSTQNKLTLFHAIIVLHLLSLLGVNLASRISSRGKPMVRFWLNAFIVLCAAACFLSFNIYVWVRAPDFGSQPECNDTVVYVLFGQSIKATNYVFRYFMLAALAAPPGVFILGFIIAVPCWIKIRGDLRKEGIDVPFRAAFWVSYENDDGSQRVNWTQEITQVMAYTGFSIYAIVSLEQIINRNHVNEEENEWTFGQIIALFLLLGPTVDFMNAVTDNFGRRAESMDSD
ncbi:hypothetical protein VTJ49DRAFT_6612 [Mycothermus thermophilus]|uniref:Uncharacterized protein n=1 Tax=Humicola insolens TaxID=85995 RepID=A0ABR3VJ01_HUMIN